MDQPGSPIDAYLWKVSLAVADEEASLATASVSHNNNLLGIGWSLGDVCTGGLAACRSAHGGANGAFAGSHALIPTSMFDVLLVVVVVV